MARPVSASDTTYVRRTKNVFADIRKFAGHYDDEDDNHAFVAPPPHEELGRTPSPQRRMNRYQLTDNPFSEDHDHLQMPQEHLQMPTSSDMLLDQPTVSLASLEQAKRSAR